MERLPAYERDPYLVSLATRVVDAGEDNRGFWVVLEDTVFYPEGGGQPADRGTVAGVEVLDVQKVQGAIRHYLAAPLAPGPVTLSLDWERRFDHMQQHTGQHLLSAVAEDRFGWKTTAFHLGREVCDVELAVPSLSPEELDALEEAVAAEIRKARAVRIHRVAPEQLASLPSLRSRGLPAGHQGPVRLVEIEGVDLATCGGTHLANTAEIEALGLLHTEPMRGGTRVYFAAGCRLRRRLHAHEARNAALRTLLGASDQELVPALQEKLSQLAELGRQLRRTQEAWAELLGRELARQAGPLASWHGQGVELPFLQAVAKAFLGSCPGGVLLATSEGGNSGFFLLAGQRPDLPALGKAVAEVLGGRGGGTGATYQGKCPSLAQRQRALERLQEMLANPA